MHVRIYCTVYTAISIKVVHEQSVKVEYEGERLLGIANKLMNLHMQRKTADLARFREQFFYIRNLQQLVSNIFYFCPVRNPRLAK